MPSNATVTDAAALGRAFDRAERARTRAASVRPALRRPRNCAVSGVSAGLARHLGWPLWIVRAAFVALTLVWGAGALLYAWLWVFVPWQDPAPDPAPGADAVRGAVAEPRYPDDAFEAARVRAVPTRRVPVAWILTGAAVVVVLITMSAIALFGANGVGWTSLPGWVGGVFLATALAVSAGAWATLVDRHDPARGPRHENIVRIVVTVVLLALLLVQLAALRQTGIPGFVFALVPIVGIVLVYSSILVDRWRELSGERVRRI